MRTYLSTGNFPKWLREGGIIKRLLCTHVLTSPLLCPQNALELLSGGPKPTLQELWLSPLSFFVQVG